MTERTTEDSIQEVIFQVGMRRELYGDCDLEGEARLAIRAYSKAERMREAAQYKRRRMEDIFGTSTPAAFEATPDDQSRSGPPEADGIASPAAEQGEQLK